MMPLGRSIGNFEIGSAKTGQVTEYGSGAGADDGYHESGVAHRFEVLTTGQYSGTTNITINAKTDAHTNEVVIDHARKLMWSRLLSNSVGPTSNGILAWTTNASGEGIFTYEAAANSASLAGHTGWRVPSMNELNDLRDMEVSNANPDATAFPSGWSTNVWSSTTYPLATTYAMAVYFISGEIRFAIKTGASYYCALARSL